MEGIDQHRRLVHGAQQEMSGEAHAAYVETDAPSHLQVDHGERDRDAAAPLEHLVEEAVLQIVVVAVIAHEVLVLK